MQKSYFFNFKKALVIGAVYMGVAASAQQWQNVGPAAVVSTGNSSYNNLAVDTSGNYYISYYDVAAGKGSVQKFNGSSWSYVGGSPGITTGLATYNALTLDALGNIYYSNQASYPATGMDVRKFSSGSWTLLIQPTASTVNFQAMAVSSNNTLFAYSSDGLGTVRRYNNGAWEQVGNAGFAGGATFAEMVIGSDNNIYTVQFASGGIKVYKINTNATSSDSWTQVGSDVGTAYATDNSYCDIALDSNNIPYVVYISSAAEGRKLNVKKFNGTSWVQIGAANFTDAITNNAAIAVSPGGAPYVIAGIWDFSNANHGKNSVYRFNTATANWEKLGDPFISTATSTYNDIAFDAVNNGLVITYSESGMRVKRMSLNSLAVNDIKAKDTFGAYPNPTEGIVYLKDERKIRTVEVSNTIGQIIAARISGTQVDISDAPKGVYFVKANYENGTASVRKIIKK